MGTDFDRLRQIVLYALVNVDNRYSQKAMEFAWKMGVRGLSFILVSKFNSKDIPKCGLSCSIGLGRFGAVFVNREILVSSNIPEELKEFIIAHEVAHIVRGHIVSKLFIVFVEEFLKQALDESLRSLEKARNIIETAMYLIRLVFLTGAAAWFAVNIDPHIVKQQELEADESAIKLVGCKGARLFANMLEQLRSRGYSISHESVLGFPALTMEERIGFICQWCP